jgi:hypothetical protein
MSKNKGKLRRRPLLTRKENGNYKRGRKNSNKRIENCSNMPTSEKLRNKRT